MLPVESSRPAKKVDTVRVLTLFLGLLPASGLKNRLLSFLPGWRVAADARVHPCVFWGVQRVEIGTGAYVGVGNYFRAMRSVVVGERAEIGQLNWLSGAGAFIDVGMPEKAATVSLGTLSGITSRHYVDCSGGLVIEERAVLGGVRSIVLTHSADIRKGEMTARPVVLGERVIVFSGVILTPGVAVAPRCVVASGAVVSASLSEPETMYGGVPARAVGSMKDAAFFERDGRLHPRDS